MMDKRALLKRKLELKKIQLRKMADDRFATYLNYINPVYRRQWFHTLIADKCQDLFEGKINKLMVFMPPQHGKSEIVSRKFPTWAFGKDPTLKIIECSYSSTLAQGFSRSIQLTIDSPEYGKLFPGSQIPERGGKGLKRDVDYFDTLSGGFYKAVGVTGSLTGTPADLGIIDDPVKDKIEAYSDTYRQRVWDWYTDVFLTRLHNNSKQLLIMTRWHEDDLAGKILKQEGDQWEVLSLPAIKEDDHDPLDPRKVGEALWEDQHSLERLRAQERRSTRTFSALYQQHPTIEGGNIWKKEWFKKISLGEFLGIKNHEVVIHFFLDTAYTKDSGNDPSGILAACRIGNNMYITDAESVYKTFPELIRWIPNKVKANGYTRSSTVRIEPKANGISVVDQLQDETTLNVVQTPPPVDSKEVRANANSAKIECGRVYIVEGSWNDQYLEQVSKFPAVAHDEYVDITNYAIDYLINDEIEIPDDIENRLPVL